MKKNRKKIFYKLSVLCYITVMRCNQKASKCLGQKVEELGFVGGDYGREVDAKTTADVSQTEIKSRSIKVQLSLAHYARLTKRAVQEGMSVEMLIAREIDKLSRASEVDTLP